MTIQSIIQFLVLSVLVAILVWYYLRREARLSPRALAKPAVALVLNTERLQVRDVEREDFEAICAYLADPDVQRYMLPNQGTRSFVESSIDASIRSAAHPPRLYYCFVVVELQTMEVIGALSVSLDRGLDQALIGWDMNKRYWGYGYATEAARTVVRFFFEQTPVKQITANGDGENKASVRVMEKLHMRRSDIDQARMRELQTYYGVSCEIVEYVLIKADWQKYDAYIPFV